jgi:hypothetical protein
MNSKNQNPQKPNQKGSDHRSDTDCILLRLFALSGSGQYSPIALYYFHIASALYQKTLD